MLEAPVTGSRNGAEQGTLLFMTGGRPEVLDELMPVLARHGDRKPSTAERWVMRPP